MNYFVSYNTNITDVFFFYFIASCFERCDPYNYGQDCELDCDCNGQFCDSVTGLCQCGPGYIGNKCARVSIVVPPPPKLVCGGYSVFTLSIAASVHPCVHGSVCPSFRNVLFP